MVSALRNLLGPQIILLLTRVPALSFPFHRAATVVLFADLAI